MFPNLDGIQYFFTVPIFLIIGLVVALIMVIIMGPSWWVLLPPVIGIFLGIVWGDTI